MVGADFLSCAEIFFILFSFTLSYAKTEFQPSYRKFHDWIVACNNTGGCTLQSINEENTFELTLYRNAGKNGLTFVELFNEQNALNTGSLSVDGVKINIDGTKVWNIYQANKQKAADSKLLITLVDHIRNSAQLQWHVKNNKEASLSLKGFTAGLLYIDEFQKRINTPTAFIRRGNQSADSIPNAAAPIMPKKNLSSLPELAKSQENRIIAQIFNHQSEQIKKMDCFVDPKDAYTEVSRLNQKEALVMIECWRGAYQSSSLLFRVPIEQPSKAKQLILPLPNAFADNKMRKIDGFTEPSFDQKTKRLFVSAKGRGLADCGESIEWQFDGQDFQLINWHYLDSCTGHSPGNWPPLVVGND